MGKKEFADWVDKILVDHGYMSYDRLGKIIGVAPATVGGWSRAIYWPHPSALPKLAEYAGVDLYWLARLAYDWPAPVDQSISDEVLPFIPIILNILERNPNDGPLMMAYFSALNRGKEVAEPPPSKKRKAKRVRS